MTSATEHAHDFHQTPDEVWNMVGSFRRYAWGAGVEPGVIEHDLPDNRVGSVRAFNYYGEPARQRLTAHDDAGRSYSWESLAPYEDIAYYEQTLTVLSLPAGGSRVVWSAMFEAPPERTEHWSAFFGDEFEKSLTKLRTLLDRSANTS